MPLRWYRSLYWRIAIGLVLCLAGILVAQGLLFVWAASRSGPRLPGQPPERFAQAVALDLSTAFERNPDLDLTAYIADQYGSAYPFVLLLTDGRRLSNSTASFPDLLMRQAESRLRQGQWAGAPRPPFGRGDPPRRPPGEWGRGTPGARGGAGPSAPRAVVLVNGQPVGLVVALPRAPFGFLLRRYAPILTLVAGSTLLLGAVLATVVIFGPARRRLRGVEEAARRLGAGDLSARAPERGGDEVAAVASAFNAMAADLSARAEALAAADRVRRQLLADVSHELTTPVTAMRGYLETLAMPEFPIDEATRQRYLGIIGDETARLERIIRELLDLARLEGGGSRLAISDVAVAALFERVRSRHEALCRETGVTLTTTIGAGAERIRGDRDRLEQALQNLAANALRYAPAGTTVQLAASRDDAGQIVLSVTDRGTGIGADHLAHVFDRFYKAEPARARRGQQPGSGLGLSIVKAIAEQHGGTVAVSSRPGETIFRIILPAFERGDGAEAPVASGP